MTWRRTECYQGHPYNYQTVRFEKITNKKTGKVYLTRRCKKCQSLNTSRWMKAAGKKRSDYVKAR